MGDINIHGVPDAEVGYSLTGKKVMVHDESAPINDSTRLWPADAFVASGASYAAPMWKVDSGHMAAGTNTFTNASLIGATQMNFIIVNKNIEFIDDDFTFDISTGTIERFQGDGVTPNNWFAGDKMVTPHKPA